MDVQHNMTKRSGRGKGNMVWSLVFSFDHMAKAETEERNRLKYDK